MHALSVSCQISNNSPPEPPFHSCHGSVLAQPVQDASVFGTSCGLINLQESCYSHSLVFIIRILLICTTGYPWSNSSKSLYYYFKVLHFDKYLKE